MSDEYTRRKRAEDLKRKRNPVQRGLKESNLLPRIDPTKEPYRRKRLDPKRIEVDYADDYEFGEED